MSQSLLGTIALINKEHDFVSNSELAVASKTGLKAEIGVGFAAVQGGKINYKSSYDLDLNSVNAEAGLAKNFTYDKSKLTTALFFDNGHGSSDDNIASTQADTDYIYYGLGLALRYRLDQGFYADLSFSEGNTDTKYKSKVEAEIINYDCSSLFYSASLGLGIVWQINDNLSADSFVRYGFNHLSSDHFNLKSEDSNRIYKNSVNSHTIRIGDELTFNINESIDAKFALSYQHVFDDESTASIDGMKIPVPSELEGNAAVIEAGVAIKATDSLRFDLGVNGYLGDQKSLCGKAIGSFAF